VKIRKLHLKNIGPFDDAELKFPPGPAGKAEIHILTGQNGSGKTTLLMALASAFDNFSGEKRQLKNLLEKRFQAHKENVVSVYLAETLEKERAGNYDAVDITWEEEKKYEAPLILQPVYLKEGEFVKGVTFRNWTNRFPIDFAVFAYSGYRKVKTEKIEAIKDIEEFNPLFQAIDFDKDLDSTPNLTINQWIANNISNRALAKEEKNTEDTAKYNYVLSALEKTISDVIGHEIKFALKRQPYLIATRINNEELDFDVLPDGLRSLISWIGDLLMRIDLLKWADDAPITDKNLILLLDEIEVHLHPAWQRKVLPVVQKLFKNAQIFVSTHSPFVVNSVDDAWVYKLELDDKGKATVAPPIRSEDGYSYSHVLSEIFGIDKEFGGQAQEDLDKFYAMIRNGKKIDEKELLRLAKSLAGQTEELNAIVQIELRQLSRRKGKEISL
jgi:predicted ATP-binding protein involved in virulence